MKYYLLKAQAKKKKWHKIIDDANSNDDLSSDDDIDLSDINIL